MTTEAVEKLRARMAQLAREQGKLPDTRFIEQHSSKVAERAHHEREELKRQPPKEKRQMEDTTTVIDRWGTRSEFKDKDVPK